EPPRGGVLQSATREGAEVELRYTSPAGETFVYHFLSADPPAAEPGKQTYRLLRLERAGNQGVIETVTIEPGDGGSPATTRYRDWSAYRDLTLRFEAVREVTGFPPDIWTP